jgi:hypothetical protein
LFGLDGMVVWTQGWIIGMFVGQCPDRDKRSSALFAVGDLLP